MRKYLRLLTLAAAVLAAVAPAQAAITTTIDFEPGTTDTSFVFFPPLLTHQDALIQGNYFVGTVSTKAGAQAGDLVGALVDGNDVASTCQSVVCPTNNPTTFLTMLDDGLPYFGTLDGTEFQIKSFDASFIAAGGVVVPSISLLLRVYGFTEDGGVFFEDALLPGPVAGAYGFSNYVLSDEFSSRSYVEVDFYGYSCNAQGSCNRTGNTAQFALDNVVLSQVPEPASLALVGLGFASIGLSRRRRQSLAA